MPRTSRLRRQRSVGTRRSARSSVVLTVIALAVVGSACGTRVRETGGGADLSIGRTSTTPSAALGDPVEPSASQAGGAGATSSARSGSAPSPGRSPGVQENAAATKTVTPIPAGKASPGSGRSPVGGSGAGVETTPTSGGGSGAAVPAPGVPSEKLPPVVIASVGNHSGPVGTAVFPVVQGAQLWARFINERGGLNGQKVRLILYDDGGDPARNRSQVQEAVEKDGAAAFLANTAPLSGEGSVDYITSKRIPVLGSDTGDDFGFYDSPMFFPQAPSRGALLDATIFGIVNQVISQNVTKFAILDCAEPAIRICESMHRKWHEHAKALGYDVVYQARPSLAQPDFTAECLSAKNAGAQIVWMALDPNSVERVAASCARQDYRPIFTTGSAVITDRFKDNPNLEGFVGSMGIFPHFQAGTPSTDEYHAALATFGKGLSNGPPLIIGWVAGKMLEKAAAGTTGPITSQTILRGLWSLRQDTLGGMTMPLTFSENQPASPVACWFEIAVKNHTWVSPDRFNQHCKDTRAG